MRGRVARLVVIPCQVFESDLTPGPHRPATDGGDSIAIAGSASTSF
jgi:hypothetical protein